VILSLAGLLALIAGHPSLARPQAALAQSYCTGSLPSISAGCSAASGYQYCYQNGIQIVPNGQSCSTAIAYLCNGVAYASPVTCDGPGAVCGGASSVSMGQACTAPMTAPWGYPNPAYTSPMSTTAGSFPGATYPSTISMTAGSSPGATYPSIVPVTSGAYPNAGYPAAIPMTTGSYLSATNASASGAQGFLVSYAAGWNLVAGPTGTVPTGAAGPIYTLGPGDATYRALPPGSALSGGAGAWAYFSANTSTSIGLVNPASMTVPLPAGQFVLIGTPGDTTATVSGADAVLVYDASTSTYHQSTLLAAGEGAWAVSMNGGQATLTNAPAARGAENNPGAG